MSGALGLGDELGIADVTIALSKQASIHDARRLHLHLRLHKHITAQTYVNMNMIKIQTGIKCQWTLQWVLEVHEHACVSSWFRNSFLQNDKFIMTVQSKICWSSLSVHLLLNDFFLQSWKQWPEALTWVHAFYLAVNFYSTLKNNHVNQTDRTCSYFKMNIQMQWFCINWSECEVTFDEDVKWVVRNISKHTEVLHRSGRPANTTPRAQHRMLNQAKKNRRITATDLEDSLELVNASVHQSVICNTWYLWQDTTEEAIALQKRIVDHLNTIGKITLWTD